jgi:hypothetical protein
MRPLIVRIMAQNAGINRRSRQRDNQMACLHSEMRDLECAIVQSVLSVVIDFVRSSLTASTDHDKRLGASQTMCSV